MQKNANDLCQTLLLRSIGPVCVTKLQPHTVTINEHEIENNTTNIPVVHAPARS